MPLLRLLHQITTMYQNVRETQMELREQRPSENVEEQLKEGGVEGGGRGRGRGRRGDGHNKNSSSGGSGSDIHEQVETSKGPLVMDKLAVPEEKDGNLNTSTTSKSSSVLATRTQSFAQRFKSSAMAVRGN